MKDNQSDSVIESILNVAAKNNGFVTSDMVSSLGYSRGMLSYLVKCGRLERIGRGQYSLPDAFEDEFFLLQGKYGRGVFSLNTALFLNDLTDVTPGRFQMTFPKGYNLSGPKKDGVSCNCCGLPAYGIGQTKISTPFGNVVVSYDAERTLCDLLNPRNHMDVSVTVSAFKRYMSLKNRNVPLLSEYAKLLRVEKRLRPYLEVLL